MLHIFNPWGGNPVLMIVRLIGLIALLFSATLSAQDLLPPNGKPAQAESPAKDISQQSTPQTDELIKKRLKDIFRNIDGLEHLQVNVNAGIVELTGEALNAQAKEKATELAVRTDGVVEVQNNIREVRSIKKRLQTVFKLTLDRFETAIGYIPLFLIAVLVICLFWFLANLIIHFDWLFKKITRHQFLIELMKQFIRGGIIILGFLLAFEILDANTLITSIIGAAGLFGLAIGFAIRDTVENYISSILLGLRQPFNPNDFVRIEESEGFVVRLTSRATILRTAEGNDIRIPNAKVFKATIINYSTNPVRRFDFTVNVGIDQDLSHVQGLAVQTLTDMEGVLQTPAPFCSIVNLGDSSVTLQIYGWLDQNRADFQKLRSHAIVLIKTVFDSAGIGMPNQAAKVPSSTQEDDVKAVVEQKAQDITPDRNVKKQIDRERKQGENLLNSHAKKE
jgi:small conductance mechanosensitive channel